MKTKLKLKEQKYILWGGGVLVALALFAGILAQAGYVFSGFFVVKGMTVKIENALPESEVYINNKRVGNIGGSGSRTFKGLTPGGHSLIVGHDGSWPWVYEVIGEAGDEFVLAPLQVNEELPTAPVPLESESYEIVTAALDGYGEPTRFAPLERDGTRVWIEGTGIFAKDGDVLRHVFSSTQPIRNIFWFGERSDTVVVATHGNVFALDVRNTGTQNYQPLYTGIAPEVMTDPTKPNLVFVRDEGEIFSISI